MYIAPKSLVLSFQPLSIHFLAIKRPTYQHQDPRTVHNKFILGMASGRCHDRVPHKLLEFQLFFTPHFTCAVSASGARFTTAATHCRTARWTPATFPDQEVEVICWFSAPRFHTCVQYFSRRMWGTSWTLMIEVCKVTRAMISLNDVIFALRHYEGLVYEPWGRFGKTFLLSSLRSIGVPSNWCATGLFLCALHFSESHTIIGKHVGVLCASMSI